MGKGDGRSRGGLTREQQAERSSTGGLAFDESLRRIVVGGPDDPDEGETMAEDSGAAESELTDEEVTTIWETTTAGVRDGVIPIFDDKESFIADARRRFVF